jgi:Holliday junction DNA helicase RuvB
MIKESLAFVSKKSRWTPRIANRLLKVVRDYHTIWHDINIAKELEEIFLNIWIDELGLDYLDRKYIETLYYKFNSWPVWLNTIAAAIWEEEATLEDVVEPYLLQIGFLERTPRGRKLTLNAEKHINNKLN